MNGSDDWKGEDIIRNVPKDAKRCSTAQIKANRAKGAGLTKQCADPSCMSLISNDKEYCRWCLDKLLEDW